jgi:hypothetical protein
VTNHARILAVAATVAVLAACDDTTGPDATVGLTLSAALAPAAAPAAPASTGSPLPPQARAETLYDGVNELVLHYVGLAVDEVELESVLDDECDDSDGEGMAGNDDCAEFEAGPFLLELPLDGSTVVEVAEVAVRPGTYDELEFEIDVPDGEDGAFVEAHPDFQGVSVWVRGTWNGEPFTFISDVEAEQEMALVPAMEVLEGDAPRNLTLTLDISGWFTDGSGALVDPSSALKGGENEALVKDNIRLSIDLFEDHDHDGEDDHEGGHD